MAIVKVLIVRWGFWDLLTLKKMPSSPHFLLHLFLPGSLWIDNLGFYYHSKIFTYRSKEVQDFQFWLSMRPPWNPARLLYRTLVGENPSLLSWGLLYSSHSENQANNLQVITHFSSCLLYNHKDDRGIYDWSNNIIKWAKREWWLLPDEHKFVLRTFKSWGMQEILGEIVRICF